MDQALANIIPVALLVAAIALALGFAFWYRHRAQENLAALAARLGFQIIPQPSAFGIITRLPNLEGRFQQRDARFFSYTKNYGKHSQTFSVATVKYAGNGNLILQLRPVSSFFKFLTGRQLEVFRTDDSDFDKSFPARSNQPQEAKNLLTPEIRAELLEARRQCGRRCGRLVIENGEVRLTVQGSFASPRVAGYLEARLPLLCRLADQVERQKI